MASFQQSGILPRRMDISQHDSTLDQMYCTISEVEHLLQGLEVSKACGPDKISAQMLKYTASSIAPSVTKLFNDVGGTGENTVSGGWDLLTVVEKKVFRSSAFCRSVLAVCSPCWSVGIVDGCLLRYLTAVSRSLLSPLKDCYRKCWQVLYTLVVYLLFTL